MLAAFLLGLGAGIAATPHCLGMCGGFPLHLAKSGGGRAVSRQILFVLGKSFTYIFLGVMAASLGVIAFKNTLLLSFAPVLRIGAGVITLMFGLLMLGLRLPAIKPLQGIAETGLVRSLFGGLLVSPSPVAALCLGLGTGFLPCPLPMGMLAVAVTSQSVFYAVALMAGVGLGTAPGLVAVGLFGIGLDKRFAKVGMRAAGIVVVVVGLLTIGRATGIISPHHPVTHAIPSCCQGHTE